MAELKEILEALIFVHRGPMDLKTMEGVLKEDFSREEIKRGLEELEEECAARGGTVTLYRVAGGYEFGTRPEVAEWVQKLDFYQHHRHLTRPSLETLAIVAYRQPVTRPEVESVRGVNCERILKGLLEKKLIRILGRKDVPGKPIVYGTTKEFLAYFGLNSLSDLPSLREFDEAVPDMAGEGDEEVAILPFVEKEEEEDDGGESAPEPQGGGEEEKGGGEAG